ncbi:hypothetical protein QBC32DRAFT_81301 [Pseudoneurospora amorphoporcata]|uniref:Uncharacterized protein n=1 Tax=Pseudoneurospora amorphoporcata TaxID=241081 RepID=A0AAN6SBI1_9PEZI|nr:hypothetical protein QBC32DRAFT_81301 [Pseudoneurospora amorphoporcata]
MSKLLLDELETTHTKLKICVQCDEAFEEGDTSKSCRYHACMFLDPEARYWKTLDPRFPIEDRPINRKLHACGYYFPCCEKPGIYLKMGCRTGKHRAADGKREKNLYGWKNEDEYRDYMAVPKNEDMASWQATCCALRRQASMELV